MPNASRMTERSKNIAGCSLPVPERDNPVCELGVLHVRECVPG